MLKNHKAQVKHAFFKCRCYDEISVIFYDEILYVIMKDGFLRKETNHAQAGRQVGR